MTQYEMASFALDALGTLAILATLGFLIGQTREMAKQSRAAAKAAVGSPWDRVATQMFAMDQVFIDHPDMRPYFYESAPIDSSHAGHNLALSIAEFRLDFFDQVVQQGRLFPDDWDLSLWREHITWCLERSPIMASQLERMSFTYSETMRQCLSEALTRCRASADAPEVEPANLRLAEVQV